MIGYVNSCGLFKKANRYFLTVGLRIGNKEIMIDGSLVCWQNITFTENYGFNIRGFRRKSRSRKMKYENSVKLAWSQNLFPLYDKSSLHDSAKNTRENEAEPLRPSLISALQ